MNEVLTRNGGCFLFFFEKQNTHIVAVVPGTSGHVYAYETIQELNAKSKNWFCLMTDEPFKRKDLITLQDPHNLAERDISQFQHYRKSDGNQNPADVRPSAAVVVAAATSPVSASKSALLDTAANAAAIKGASSGINARGTTARILAELAPKRIDSSAHDDSAAAVSTTATTRAPRAGSSGEASLITPSFVSVKSRAYNQLHYSDNAAAAAFTSMGRLVSGKIKTEGFLFCLEGCVVGGLF
jgi:peptidyl-prolyl cis-trans isomerase-like protein 2